MAVKDKIVNLEDLKAGVDNVCIKQEATIKKVKSLTSAEYEAIAVKDPNTLYNITDDAATADAYTKAETDAKLLGKLNASKCTYQTVAPTADITDGGVHIVHLASATGVTEYTGYIYMYDEG